LPRTRNGFIEAISLKAIIAAIITVLGFYFAVPEYIYDIRLRLLANLGSDSVCWSEGAIMGAITVILVLKLYSQFSSRSKEVGRKKPTTDVKKLKRRVKEELQILEKPINQDLEDQDFKSKTYSMDAFQNLKSDIILALRNKNFREIKEAYDKINSLQYSANLGEISIRKYKDAIECIKRAIELLK